MSDHARRAAYLGALGIDQWVPRRPPSVAPAAVLPVASAAPAGVDDGWAALESLVRDCRRCALHEGRTQTVFGSGSRTAEWMVIGEAPGEEEDRQGEPFVGASGQLLTAMLAAIGLPRDSVFIANIVKCRPPGNRDPRPEEAAACRDHLDRQVELLRPRLILAFGKVAAQNLLGAEATVGSLRGAVHRFGPLNTPVVVTYHPAYLLRSPGEKRKAWEDLKFARQVFADLPSRD
ncbi:MAG: uracil-DNA glycosylase [Gammaproteobacteria bacterium]